MESSIQVTPPLIEEEVPNDFLAEGEKIIENVNQEYKNKNELTPLTIELLKRKTIFYIENLINEVDESKALATAQLLAKMYALPGNLVVYREIYNLHTRMKWDQWGIINDLSIDKENIVTKKVNLISREIFNHYGMNPERTMSAWREAIFPIKNKTAEENLSEEGQQACVFQNFRYLKNLEDKRPHSASFLADEFGIMNFGRYPLEMLIDQYDNAEDMEHPYGIVITAARDYNGAFYNGREEEVLNSLSNQLNKENYKVRMVESGGKFTFARFLVRFNEKYGARQKISFAIIRTHGNKDCLSLGDWSEDEEKKAITSFHSRDLKKSKTLEKIKQFFTDHATIILDSCSTGQRDGIAQNIFKQLGIQVLAPKKNGGIDSIDIKNNNNKLDFNVKYDTNSLFFPIKKAQKYS